MRHYCALCALPLLFLLSFAAQGQESQSTRTAAQLARLQSRLQELADAFPGVIGVTVRDIRTGEEVSINGDRPFPMFNQRLPRYLPESARMAHKTGTIGSTTNDAGIMFVRGNPIAVAVFTVDKRIARGEVEERMGRLTRAIYDFFDAVK